MKKDQTTIALSKKTVDKLKSLGKKGETYDEIIQQLLRRRAIIDADIKDEKKKGMKL